MDVDRIVGTLPEKSSQERDRIRSNAERLREEGDAAQQAAAGKMIAALDDLETSEHQQLVDRLSGMEVASRVVEAFRAHPMTETEAKVVQVLLDHPGSSSSELSQALGWGAQSWHMHFGTMCFNRAVYLWPAPKSETRKKDFYSGILADWSPEQQWTIKPEVVSAFAELGLQSRDRC